MAATLESTKVTPKTLRLARAESSRTGEKLYRVLERAVEGLKAKPKGKSNGRP